MTTFPRRRGVKAAALLASLGLLLSACSGDDGAGGGGGDLSAPGPEVLDDLDEAVQVEFWHSMDATNGQVLDELIEGFNAENEGRVQVTGSFQGDYDTALANHRAAIQQGDTAELIMIYDLGTQFMIDSGQTVPAQSFIDEDGYDTAEVEEALLNYFTVGGELRSFPFNNSTPLMYINRDAFEEAGLDPDSPPTDLAEIREAAEDLTITDDDGTVVQYGFGAAVYGWFIEQFMARAAVPYCDNSNGRDGRATEVLFDDPKIVELVEWWDGMIEDDLAVQIGRNTDDGAAAFTSGRAAMTLESTGSLGGYIEQSDFEVGAGYFPLIGADDPGGSIIGGASLWINGEGHSPEEVRGSWEFVQYLLTPESQSVWHAGTGYLAVNTEGYNGPEAQERAEEFPQFSVAANQLADSEINENTAGCMMGVMSEARVAAEEGWETALTSDATAEEAMADAAGGVGRTIEEYNASVEE
ncbi:ABC transporter substrate-binding protein [Nocardiopsis sp. MG754419]|uniref:ABC transporter substrate-binding protein n=1 Tax=Nocardiopsis sp. MG754419 TaxID=2259865 RepID=UPI001BADD047|nr:ABC transporter substrate-binding protein [Nocardiopsis sp. MG754419]MBR8740495.1 ABC transporter substrate-binding protein [Nocardiopsis sp. MG754419]